MKGSRTLPLLFCIRQGASMSQTPASSISVQSAGFHPVNGLYESKPPSLIPAGFDRTCRAMRWDTQQMWHQLSDLQRPWYESENESYIYWNKGDGKWWIDGPSGAGVYIVKNGGWNPPKHGWMALDKDYEPLPSVMVIENKEKESEDL